MPTLLTFRQVARGKNMADDERVEVYDSAGAVYRTRRAGCPNTKLEDG